MFTPTWAICEISVGNINKEMENGISKSKTRVNSYYLKLAVRYSGLISELDEISR